MQIVAFIVALGSVVCAVAEFARTESLLSLSVGLFVIAIIVQWVWLSGTHVTLN